MNAIVLPNAAPPEAGTSGVAAWSQLEQVRAATTVARGDLDLRRLRDYAEALLAGIPGAGRADLPGMAHLPYLEHTDLVAHLITAAETRPL